jgi:oligoendopeptidase F
MHRTTPGRMIEPKTKTGQRKKFDFAAFKEVATHPSRATRKAAFVEYFEDFHEFPSSTTSASSTRTSGIPCRTF